MSSDSHCRTYAAWARRRWLPMLIATSHAAACDSALQSPTPNPIPVVEGTEPLTLFDAGIPVSLAVVGLGFVDGAVAHWNGESRPTTFESDTRLSVELGSADLSVPGQATLTILNPEPGGGPSPPMGVTVGFPVPSLDSALFGGGSSVTGVTLNVWGSRFVPGASGARVRWDGVPLMTSVMSSTVLAASVPDYLLRDATSATITVVNPSPGGGASNPVGYTWNNPLPAVTSTDPTTVRVGTPATLSISGSGFAERATVLYGGTRLAPSSVFTTRLTVTVPGTLNTSGSVIPVAVENPGPGGGASNSVPVTVWERAPRIHQLLPPDVVAGAPAFTLTIVGAEFWQTATLTWNGQAHAATVVNQDTIQVPVGSADVASQGPVDLVVSNPTPGGDGAAQFSILPPAPPTLTDLSPRWVHTGAPATTLALTGSTFAAGAVVRWNGQTRPATVVSSTRIEVPLSTGDFGAPGPVEVRVSNPNAAGDASAVFHVVPPRPTDPVVYEAWGGLEIVTAEIDGTPRTTVSLPHIGFHIDASPIDGTVTYSAETESQVWLISLPSGAGERLNTWAADTIFHGEGWPKFSASGEWVYFQGSPLDSEIWRTRTDGSGSEVVLRSPGEDLQYPAPSSTGDKITYVSGSGEFGALWVLDVGTSTRTALGVTSKISRWSPTDEWIAYVAPGWHLRVIRPDGTGDHELAPGFSFGGGGFDWSDDGNFIVGTDPFGTALLVAFPSGVVWNLGGFEQLGSIAWYNGS